MTINNSKINVLIASSDAIVCKNIISILAPRINIVGTASNGRELIEMTLEFNPNIILMDIDISDIDGISVIEMVMSQHVGANLCVRP
jgi:chemotaxis response regulator CheB